MLLGVEQAASDAQIIKTLEGGATALEKLNKEIGGIEKVEKIMDRVRDGMEESEEVGKVIAELGSSRVDEVEIEEEFDELLKAEEEEQQKKREMEKLKEEEAARQKAEQEKLLIEARAPQDMPSEEKKTDLADELKNVSLEPKPREPLETEQPTPA